LVTKLVIKQITYLPVQMYATDKQRAMSELPVQIYNCKPPLSLL